MNGEGPPNALEYGCHVTFENCRHVTLLRNRVAV